MFVQNKFQAMMSAVFFSAKPPEAYRFVFNCLRSQPGVKNLAASAKVIFTAMDILILGEWQLDFDNSAILM